MFAVPLCMYHSSSAVGFQTICAARIHVQRTRMPQFCAACMHACASADFGFLCDVMARAGKASHLFAYRVTVHNTRNNKRTVQLVGRQWEILDADGNISG
jgi:hypothetical protein